eukprot:m.33743 g.33743  ORF g.33743 m.33743 type:complete len:524 (-) comp11047_c1_seq1:441-2012(-)
MAGHSRATATAVDADETGAAAVVEDDPSAAAAEAGGGASAAERQGEMTRRKRMRHWKTTEAAFAAGTGCSPTGLRRPEEADDARAAAAAVTAPAAAAPAPAAVEGGQTQTQSAVVGESASESGPVVGESDGMDVDTKVAPGRADGIQAVMTKVHPAPANASSNTHLFYASSKWFGFHALHQILFERVQEICQLSKEIADEHAVREGKRERLGFRDVPVSVALSMKTPLETPYDKYYEAFLSMTERLINGDIEVTAYEETMREMFNIKAYKLFTIDRLLQSIARQLQALVTDQVAQSLSGVYLRSQTDPAIDYRSEVMEVLEDSSNVFRIEQKKPRHVTIELLDTDLSESDAETATEKWMKYVDKYVKLQTDPELESLLKVPIFLKRNKRIAGYADDEAKAMLNVTFNNNLECKICVNTYKMLFVIKSEDYWHRHHSKNKSATTQPSKRKSRFEKFRKIVSAWETKNTTEADRTACHNWLMGPEGSTTFTAVKTDDSDYGQYVTAAPAAAVAAAAAPAPAVDQI